MNDSEKLRKFIRSVVKVNKRRKEREKATQELGKHIDKIKKLTGKKNVKKASVSRALKELEKKISEVLEKEKQAIALQERDISRTKGIANELKSMEEKFSSFTTKDIQIINQLKQKIEHLEQDKGEHIDRAVNELKEKLEELNTSRTERDKRILELEEKIKQKVSDNFVELMKIEHQLANMQVLYRKMKQEGKHDKGVLDAFKNKISSLKRNLFTRKQKLIKEEMKKGAPLPDMPVEKPKDKQTNLRNLVRHDIKFKPLELPLLPEPPKPQESFKEILEEERVPILRLRREQKKKGFFKKLFG